MIVPAVMLAAQTLPPPPVVVMPPADPAICEAGQKLATSLQPGLPKMEDARSRLDGFSVNCATRTFRWDRTVLDRFSGDARTWKDRQQVRWSEAVCNSRGFSLVARTKWHLVQHLTFLDGTRIVFEADCH